MKKISSRSFWVLLFVLHFILRMPTLWTTILNIDESQFSIFAHTLMDGGLPFLDSVDTKPLGMYYYFIFCFLLFGRYSMFGVHLITLLWSFFTPVLLYRTCELYKKNDFGRSAALLFVIFSVGFLPEFLATSIVNVMLPLLTLSVYFVMKSQQLALKNSKTKMVLAYDALAGLILGVAFLFKYQAGIQTVHFFILSLVILWRTRQFVHFLLRNCIFGIMFALPFVLQAFYLYHLNVWSEFLLWTQANQHYISHGMATSSFLYRFVWRVGTFVGCTLALWFLAEKVVFHKWDDPDLRDLRDANFLWFILSFIAMSVGGRFYPHYFLQILPALSALGGMGWMILQKWHKRFVLSFTIVSMLVFFALRFDHRLFFKYFPDDELYQQEEIGLKLKTLAHADDKVFVWGFATAIYFYSQLEPASRFLWCDWLVARPLEKSNQDMVLSEEMQAYLARNWDFFWQDLQKSNPRFFVDTSIAGFHMYQNFQISKYPELQNYITTHYHKMDQIQGVDIYERNLP